MLFGGLTTLVNFIVYFAMVDVLHIYYLASNLVAWILSVLFAYVTNRRYVFNSQKTQAKEVRREALSFFACRGLSGLMDMVLLYLLVDVMAMNDGTAKVLVTILVIVLNYVLSKWLVFRKEAPPPRAGGN